MILESLSSSQITLVDIEPPIAKKDKRFLPQRDLPELFWRDLQKLPTSVSVNSALNAARNRAIYLSRYTQSPIPSFHPYCALITETYENSLESDHQDGKRQLDDAFNAKLVNPDVFIDESELNLATWSELSQQLNNDVVSAFSFAMQAKTVFNDKEITMLIKNASIENYKAKFESLDQIASIRNLQMATCFRILFPEQKQLLTMSDSIPQDFIDILPSLGFQALAIAAYHLSIISADRVDVDETGLKLTFLPELPKKQVLERPVERKF